MASTGETHLRTQPTSTSSAPCFDCSICLDVAVDPVVTLCGHLYCWPCIYKWLHGHHHDCPVCNGPLSTSSLVPLYGRGSKPSSPSDSSDPTVPRRPRRAAPEPAPVELLGGFPAGSPTVHSIFGGTAVAAMGLRCTDPYLGAYGGSGAAAAEVRSLQRISGFLLCGVLLCLLLF